MKLAGIYIYISNSLHLARKYAQIFVRGSVPRNGAERSFEEQRMSKDKYLSIFLKPNGGYCGHFPSNSFCNT